MEKRQLCRQLREDGFHRLTGYQTGVNMKTTRLTDGWKVYRDKDAFSLVYTLPEDAPEMKVPYDAMWHEEQRREAVSAGRTSYLDGGVYHYYKELFFPASARGEKILLRFDGVFTKSYVYLNGSQVGQGDFGYVGYYCDITDFIRFGSVNILLVVAKTPPLSSRWYSGGGICRDVWLLEGRGAYIKPGSFYMDTLEVTGDGVLVNLKADIANTLPYPMDVKVRLMVMEPSLKGPEGGAAEDREGRPAQDGSLSVREFSLRLFSGSKKHLEHRVLLQGIKTWSEETPELYDCRLEILSDADERGMPESDADRCGMQVCDSEIIRTGFRVLSWDAARGLTVNGRTVKLRGGCLHHDEGLLGGISTFDYEYRRVKRMKEAGFNAIRSAHNHAAPALLAACDALGVMVLDEVCDMWTKMKGYEDYTQYFADSWKRTVRSMVQDDRRHPCVVGYSTGNEISDICTDRGIETSLSLYHYFKELDGSRFVTNGINGAFAAGDGLLKIAADITGQDESVFADGDVNKFMILMATKMESIVRHPVVGGILEQLDPSMDVMGYNYMTARYAPDAEKYPDRLMLGTETYPKQIAQNWRNIMAIPQCVGDFTWTGWDYMGELGETPDNYPAWNNESGDIDTMGSRKPVSYYREIVFGLRTQPYICVRPPKSFGTPRQFGPWKFTDGRACWKFPEDEFAEENTAHLLEVEVYSPAQEVELFINGRSLGRKACGSGSDYYTIYEVPYEPGTLEAVNLGEGAPAGERFALKTAGEAERLVIEAESGSPLPESEGLVFLNIHFEDKDGAAVPGSGQELKVEYEGAELLGFGSAGSEHRKGFAHSDCVFAGEGAMAILKKTAESGCAKVWCAGTEMSAEVQF